MTRLVFYSCLFLQLISSNRTMAKVSTACYVAQGIGCTEHRLTCTQPLVVSITNITFGYRQGCSISGVSNCVNTACCNTACCREETGDCFTPYNQTLLLQLQLTCNGESSCILNIIINGLTEVSSYCFVNTRHAYSKIEYQCITNTPKSATQPTTEASSPSPTPQQPIVTTSPSLTSYPATNAISSTTVSTKFTSIKASTTDLTNRQETMARVSTACLGSIGLLCTEHRLICKEPLVISITNITFGYRRGCVPLSSCGDTTCCREETGDCFTPYNKTLLSQLQQTCNERTRCTLNRNDGLNDKSSYCFTSTVIFHSYSKITYHCITNKLPTPPADSTTSGLVLATEREKETDTDIGAIVGGIVGVIIVTAIVGTVILFIKRRLKKLKSQNEHQYDSPPNRIIDQPTPVDDSLNTRQQTDERTQYINEQPLPATTNGQTQDNYVTQDYEHAYDSAPCVVTDEPKAVYDSLNTREQTGYYNMGNITDDNQLSTTSNGCTPITTNNPDYEHAYSALDHDTNKSKTVYDSLNT